MFRRKFREIYQFFSTNKKRHGNYKTITYRLKFVDIALDLRQPHCQVLLVTCLGFTKKNANHAKKETKIMSECTFIGLKNNRLHYKCKECNDESHKSKMD